jgi:hypothetical protein
MAQTGLELDSFSFFPFPTAHTWPQIWDPPISASWVLRSQVCHHAQLRWSSFCPSSFLFAQALTCFLLSPFHVQCHPCCTQLGACSKLNWKVLQFVLIYIPTIENFFSMFQRVHASMPLLMSFPPWWCTYRACLPSLQCCLCICVCGDCAA